MEKINNYTNVERYKYKTIGYQSNIKRLKDMNYSFSDGVDLPSDMYPQGICFSENYAFITAYSDDKEVLGKIMVFDKQTGIYLLSLGMDTKSHLGGIAYDGMNLWICNSSKLVVERISYTFICDVIKKYEGKNIDIRNLVEQYPVNLIPSCITFYDGRLWIATHTKQTNSQMIAYQFNKIDNRLYFDSIYHIPSKVQGIAFDENSKVILSTSYGRRNSSYLKQYSSVEKMSKNVEKYDLMIELPPCSEGIAIDHRNLYVIFESAGEKYLEGTDGKGKSLSPLDKILQISL